MGPPAAPPPPRSRLRIIPLPPSVPAFSKPFPKSQRVRIRAAEGLPSGTQLPQIVVRPECVSRTRSESFPVMGALSTGAGNPFGHEDHFNKNVCRLQGRTHSSSPHTSSPHSQGEWQRHHARLPLCEDCPHSPHPRALPYTHHCDATYQFAALNLPPPPSTNSIRM